MNRTAINALLLVTAIALGSYAAWQWQQQRVPPPEAVPRSDYVLRDFELTALNDQGTEAFTLRSPYLEREPDGRSLDIRLPVFSFPGESGTWNARSDTAWVSDRAQEVQLRGAVELLGPASDSGLRTRFTTGLRVDMAAKRFQLLHDTQGTLCATPASC
ncbi:MAG TPA: LPS export ABC transporter periplasmic protein LptC [Arenimonas sp.]|nr:LPS export ABC transporter periplasmic protein LptC [Arenimonas sp.]